MHAVIVDWSTVSSASELLDVLFRETQAPTWHGRNLDALNDSWVTGDINPTGPPYHFRFLNCDSINPCLRDIATRVMEIAEDSVHENGGSCTKAS